jgi:hypothetical protein
MQLQNLIATTNSQFHRSLPQPDPAVSLATNFICEYPRTPSREAVGLETLSTLQADCTPTQGLPSASGSLTAGESSVGRTSKDQGRGSPHKAKEGASGVPSPLLAFKQVPRDTLHGCTNCWSAKFLISAVVIQSGLLDAGNKTVVQKRSPMVTRFLLCPTSRSRDL